MSNKKYIPVITGAVIVVLVCVLAVVLNPGTDSVNECSAVLTKYYEAYYKTGDLNSLKECVPPELVDETDLAFTLGGVVNLLSNYVLDTKSALGDDFEVSVEITNSPEATAALRNEYKTQFSGVTMAVNTAFNLSLNGKDNSLKFHGSIDMVKTNGQWYITSYSIPLYED